jgi:hypothetical protein
MLTSVQRKSESGPASNNFVSRTLTFDDPTAVGVKVVVNVELYTSSGVQASAGMISDDGGHTWVRDAGIDGDATRGGVATLSTVTTVAINSITLTPGGSGNYGNWSIDELSGDAEVDDFGTGSGNSTAPEVTGIVATTTDGLAFSTISTGGQGSPQTAPSGWTATETETDNGTNLAGAIAISPNISSAGAVGVLWATANSGQWYACAVLYKATGGGGGAAFIPPAWRRRTILQRR